MSSPFQNPEQNMFDRLFQLFDRTGHRRRRMARSMSAERLESRELLSLLAGETQVPFTTFGDQIDPAVASASDSRSVVVWSGPGPSNTTDIFAQRFDANGAKVGAEIKVVATARDETRPDVAMDANGNFMVIWEDAKTFSNTDLKAQRFSSAGVKSGGVISVAISALEEIEPSVASDSAGNFAVTWTVVNSNTGDKGIQARRFRNDGVALGAAFSVANSAQTNEQHPDIARAPDGRFAITFQSGTDGNVILKRYAANASLVGTHTIAAGAALQIEPRVSMDTNANTMVAWQEISGDNSRIRARRVTNAGVVAATINITSATGFVARPEIALKRNGSSFVVTYYDPTVFSSHLVERTIAGAPKYAVTLATSQAGAGPRFKRTAIAFGSGTNYRIVYERFPNNSTGVNIYLRRGRLS
jgi:hypothetical protein